MIGAGARALIERGFEAAGKELTPAYLDELFRQFMVHYGENICVQTRLFPGRRRGPRHGWSEAGFILAVCTNKVEEHSVKLLDELGDRPSLRRQLRPRHLPVLQARSAPSDPDHRAGRRRSGAGP